MMLMLAAIFRQSSRLAAEARGGQAVFQTARQVYETLGRDLAGLTRDGLLFLRSQQLPTAGGSAPSGLILYYGPDGLPVRINKGRLDVLVLSVAGEHTSAVDSGKASSFARVIWAQTERASGNNLTGVPDTPKYWGVNLVLARHQTLMVPDALSVDAAAGAYGGSNRGPDYYNMSLSDVTRFFGPAMGSGDSPHNPVSAETYGLFKYDELAPYEPASKVWRFGRSGPGPNGPGAEGGGDLTSAQVDSDQAYPDNASYHGQERPKIFGPADYHRIAAFGVAAFQVDWSDGRRDLDNNGRPAKLLFYPADAALTATGNYNKTGPGTKYMFAWNALSPTSVRDTSVRTSFVATNTRYYNPVVYDPYPVSKWRTDPPDWEAWNLNTQQMFAQYSSSGAGGVGRCGWPWPRALRVRLLIYDNTQDPPVGYQFEQVYHLLVQ
jgi:hypothetical protein